MKVSISDQSGETKEIRVGDEPVVAGPEMDRASLWTLLAVLFFGAFLLMFIFLNRFGDANDDSRIDRPLDDSIDVEDPIDDIDGDFDTDGNSGSSTDTSTSSSSSTPDRDLEGTTPMAP